MFLLTEKSEALISPPNKWKILLRDPIEVELHEQFYTESQKNWPSLNQNSFSIYWFHFRKGMKRNHDSIPFPAITLTFLDLDLSLILIPNETLNSRDFIINILYPLPWSSWVWSPMVKYQNQPSTNHPGVYWNPWQISTHRSPSLSLQLLFQSPSFPPPPDVADWLMSWIINLRLTDFIGEGGHRFCQQDHK